MNKKNKDLRIYTTGAFLKAKNININGKDYWFWVVEEFTDDSFLDGKTCNPKEFAKNKDDLLIENDCE